MEAGASDTTNNTDADGARPVQRRKRKFRVALLGAFLAACIGYVLWLVSVPGDGRPNVWLGIGLTAVGLLCAGWAGTNSRDIEQQDRCDEWAVTSLLAVLAIAVFAIANERFPPLVLLIIAIGLVAVSYCQNGSSISMQ